MANQYHVQMQQPVTPAEKLWLVNIVKLLSGEDPHPSTTHLSGRETIAIDIGGATKEELLQARTDLNNRSIKQDFDDNKDVSSIRSELHAALLNRLHQLNNPNA